jgi:hypothetical protein
MMAATKATVTTLMCKLDDWAAYTRNEKYGI